MNKKERFDPQHEGVPLPEDDDLDFVLDGADADVEIDLDLPDWPSSSDVAHEFDTGVIDPGVTPARAARTKAPSNGDEFESLMDGLELDYDLPLPSKAAAKRVPTSPADPPKPDRTSSGKTPRDAVPAATRKPQPTQAAPVSPAAARDQDAHQTKRTVAPQGKQPGQAKAAADQAANGARKRPAAANPARGAQPAAKRTATQSPARAAADQTDPRSGPPGSPDLPGLPDDPGYDIISPETGASTPTPAAGAPAPASQAAEPEKRRPRRGIAVKVLLGVAVVAGLACGALGLYAGWFGGDDGSSQYEAIRARAASRSRSDVAAKEPAPAPRGPAEAPQTAAPADAAPAGGDALVEIGIAYGTEKRNWLEWAAGQFAATDEGRRIQVRLIPMGSLEGAHAVLDGDKRIHVWSPASSLYREAFVRDWEAKFQPNPILKEEALALSPMILVMWKSRYEAFTAKSPEVSLRTIWYAMQAKQGWATIAGKPQWGRFKFGHTHPNQSNSGLMTLVVLAYSFLDKSAGVTVGEIMAPQFQDYLTQFNAGVAQLSNSTGNLMKDMALKGPSSYDALIVYESVAIDYLESAEGRWEPLQVVYPKQNLWNENPYCILNTPWTTEAHQKAAQIFLKFLLSEPIQARALDHGFRPANAAVPVKGPESPFIRFADHGLSVELAEMCEVPSREVIENLQQMWIRTSVQRGPGGP